MECFTCRVPLQMTERQGVEIDYCPKCRGVWLDRGELDKIIERSAQAERGAADPRTFARPEPEGWRRRDRDDDDDDRYRGHRKRKGLLGELFDI